MPRYTAGMSANEGLFEGGVGIGGTVTAVRALASDPAWVSVLVDGKRAARLRAEDAVALGVRVGQAWTAELAGAAGQAGARGAALRAGLRLVGSRQRTRRDVLDRLVRKGHSREAATAAVERLAGQGLIDDAAAGAAAAESMLARRPAGARAIEAKLRRIGLEGERARAMAREAVSGRDEVGDAEAVARDHARKLPAGLEAAAKRRRIMGRLARRGFGTEACIAAVERVLGGAGEG